MSNGFAVFVIEGEKTIKKGAALREMALPLDFEGKKKEEGKGAFPFSNRKEKGIGHLMKCLNRLDVDELSRGKKKRGRRKELSSSRGDARKKKRKTGRC